jgi:predicted neuraminidase
MLGAKVSLGFRTLTLAASLATLAFFPAGARAQTAGRPFFDTEIIFPLEHWHNHSSSIVELPNGDFLVAWFHGSGERTADDVVIQGARWSKAKKAWGKPFLMADTPFFPDTNCVLYIDSQQRLWLLWPAILANEWHTALMKYRLSTDYQQAEGPPNWDWSDNILLIPKNIAERTKEVFGAAAAKEGPEGKQAAELIGRAQDKYFSRVGWFTRTHPIELPTGRMIVPLYSDGYSFSLMALSDDAGKTWFASEPIVGAGNIQPSVVRRKDGTLVAYMRDNGPPPKRIHISTSSDDGMSWAPAADTNFPNPGSSVEAIALRDGSWILVYNDTEKGRNSLAVSRSDDEGKTWKWKRHIERDEQETEPSSFHYPSVMQASDGTIHVTYSYFINSLPQDAPRKAIKHASFNIKWIEEN